MKRLTVVAPAEQVEQLRELAKAQYMTIYKDGAYLRFKFGLQQPVFDKVRELLPEGSYELYCTNPTMLHPKFHDHKLNAVRIRVK